MLSSSGSVGWDNSHVKAHLAESPPLSSQVAIGESQGVCCLALGHGLLSRLPHDDSEKFKGVREDTRAEHTGIVLPHFRCDIPSLLLIHFIGNESANLARPQQRVSHREGLTGDCLGHFLPHLLNIYPEEH